MPVAAVLTVPVIFAPGIVSADEVNDCSAAISPTGDAFTNLIVPTSGALIGTLGVARLDWAVWARFQVRLQALLFLAGSIVVVLAVLAGFQ